MIVDPEIIRQAQNGDDDAFSAVFRVYKQRVFGTVYRILGRRDAVEDVGQDVFIRLHQSLGQLRTVEVFETWLYRLTVNTVYDHLRKQRRRCDVPLADLSEDQIRLADAAAAGKDMTISRRQAEARNLLQSLFVNVSKEDRQLLMLKEVQGLTLKEMKGIYQSTENALKVRLFRARKRACRAYAEMPAAQAVN